MEDQSGGKRRVTIREAATLLGVHYNTVRNRINDGTYEAEKVITNRGPTWMIDPDSLTDNAPTSTRQQGVVGVNPAQQAALQELARQIVGEAGISQDPELQIVLEGNKLEAEAAKTQATLATASLVGMAAVASLFPTSSNGLEALVYLLAALVLVLLSLVATLIALHGVARASAEGARYSGFASLLGALLLGLGLFVFAFYEIYGLSLVTGTPFFQQRGPGFWLTVVVAVPLVLGAVSLASAILRRRRLRRRSQQQDTEG